MKKLYAPPVLLAILILGILAGALYFTRESVTEKPTSNAATTPISGTAAVSKNEAATAISSVASRVSDELSAQVAEQPVIRDFPMADSEVEMTVKDQTIKLTGNDGLFDRVFIEEKKPLKFTVKLAHLQKGRPILITAPNGGNLSRANGPLEYKADGDSVTVELDFTPTLGRGAYTIRIQHAGESQIIDLWAGARNPLGEPGPAYVQQTPAAATE